MFSNLYVVEALDESCLAKAAMNILAQVAKVSLVWVRYFNALGSLQRAIGAKIEKML